MPGLKSAWIQVAIGLRECLDDFPPVTTNLRDRTHVHEYDKWRWIWLIYYLIDFINVIVLDRLNTISFS